ncbi:DMT family protein [Chitinilyticum piscinae]|uniref:DMT family protein n=1 Tax=Chitinilyticum piscinae TaxID=2866724 RepID=A0A8J7K2X0_9NEIS|nr:DMT family protein [Chitinilyticum piscinae]MBE9610582.1 DMT family protein [Chitinilyticum piscinae]
MPPALSTILLLVCSNLFMSFAWYAHLKHGQTKPWLLMVFMSWGIALFEYLLMVPANRIGYQVFSLAQLKILQEVIALSVFIPFAVFYMREPFNWNYIWAALCMVGAVFFMFRG